MQKIEIFGISSKYSIKEVTNKLKPEASLIRFPESYYFENVVV